MRRGRADGGAGASPRASGSTAQHTIDATRLEGQIGAVDTLTIILVCSALGLILLDVFVPSGGILAGSGIAVLIERVLAANGVITLVRWPLAAVGMLATVALAVRYGERVSEALFPARARTNVDRLIGMTGKVRRIRAEDIVVELEGDLWTAHLAAGAGPVEEGASIEVVALRDHIPIVRPI